MHDGNRGDHTKNRLIAGIFVAALFVIAFGWPAFLTQREIQNDASRNAGYYSERAQKNVAAKCGGLSGQARSDCADPIEEAARSAQRDEYDLAAQETVAVWTAVMGGVAVFGVALSAVGVFLVWTTFAETRKANDIANDALDGQLRPWVNFDAEFLGLEYTDGKLKIRVKAKFQNRGASPALYLTYTASLFNERMEGERVFNLLPELFERDKRKHHDKALFPSEPWDKGFFTKIEVPVGPHPLMLVVAARYRSPYSDRYRYTCKIYDITGPDGLIDVGESAIFTGVKMRKRDNSGDLTN
jgi:hypothetical protein